jgi:hypothetical protein
MAPQVLEHPGTRPTETECTVDTTTVAHQRTLDTRELRALELYRTRGHEIHHAGEDLYLVPSCTGRGFYSVDYCEETCDCPDFLRRRENCKHILAVGVHVAKRRRQRPHACSDGWVSMEVEVLDPDTGEERFEEALYLCRKCAERS